MNRDADVVAKEWLFKFESAVAAGDVTSITSLFLKDGWLRDILVFSWTHRSLCGRDAISSYLSSSGNLRRANVQKFDTDANSGIPITFVDAPGAPTIAQATFTFETPIAYGKGLIRLMRDEDDEWRAFSAFFTLDDWKGHEERGVESTDRQEDPANVWGDVERERRARIEKDPYVIIIGAAQTGLSVGARFQRMNIPALIIEQDNTIGDVWRHRYPSLTLHTNSAHHTLLYQSYPKDWPLFTPRDKIASWLEQYAMTHDLVVWTNSRVAPTPSYDPSTKRWTITVVRNGQQVTLHPYHIVSAMGTLGSPYVPSLPGQSKFNGEIMHTSAFKGGLPYAGKNAVVIGAGNSGADVCQALAANGAASVTMVQRSSTIVNERKLVASNLLNIWKQDQDSAIGDFLAASMPLGLLRQLNIRGKEERVKAQRQMLDGLRTAGLKVDEGQDDSGSYLLMYMRFGGYWLDVGAADMIIEGKIKVKQGTPPKEFIERGLVFEDGSTIEADLVVFATGYESVVEKVREIFGDDVADKTSSVWGLNEENEPIKSYTPSGYPGFWYALGDFYNSRYYSKSLALQIKARELGLVED